MILRTAIRLTAVCACLLMLTTGGALAQGTSVSLGVENHDSSVPLEITSEELDLDQTNGNATFVGDVIARQAGITMTCDRMLVEYEPNPETGKNEIQVIRMFGGVTFASAEEAAESHQAVYTLANEIMVMTGNVLVTQGATALSSDRLTYNLDTGEGLMEGNVKTILQQGSN